MFSPKLLLAVILACALSVYGAPSGEYSPTWESGPSYSCQRLCTASDKTFDYVIVGTDYYVAELVVGVQVAHDIISVVGGGTAGLVVAARLSEDPAVTVAVIEGGAHHVNEPLVDTPSASCH